MRKRRTEERGNGPADPTKVDKTVLPTIPVADEPQEIAGVGFHLVLVNPPGPLQYRSFALVKSPTVIGRDNGCDIPIERSDVSRRHAELIRRGAGWTLRDLNSSNGTFANNTQIQEVALETGMSFFIAHCEFAFLERDDPALARYQRYLSHARRDELTALPNSDALEEFLLRMRDTSGEPIALILLEVDDFQRLNREYGREAGDHILVSIATKQDRAG